MSQKAFGLFIAINTVFLCASVSLAAEPVVKYCRVRFGESSKDVVIARTSDSILIYRDADLDSEPERHVMKDASLPGDAIKPFRDRTATYEITTLEEHREDERHVLLVHVKTSDVVAPLTQIAEIELCNEVEKTQCGHFGGPLKVGPLQETPGDVYPSRLEIGVETQLMGTISTADEGACITHVESLPGRLLATQSPKVTIEFPSRDPEKPIVQSFPLDTFC